MLNRIIEEERFRLMNPAYLKSLKTKGNIIGMPKDFPLSHEPEDVTYIVRTQKEKTKLLMKENELRRTKGRILHYFNRVQDLAIGNFQENTCIRTYVIDDKETMMLIDGIMYTAERNDILGEYEHHINIRGYDLSKIQNFMINIFETVTERVLSHNYDTPIELMKEAKHKTSRFHDDIFNEILTQEFTKDLTQEIKDIILSQEQKCVSVKEKFRNAI